MRTIDDLSITRQTVAGIYFLLLVHVVLPELGVRLHPVLLAAILGDDVVFGSDRGHVERLGEREVRTRGDTKAREKIGSET